MLTSIFYFEWLFHFTFYGLDFFFVIVGTNLNFYHLSVNAAHH